MSRKHRNSGNPKNRGRAIATDPNPAFVVDEQFAKMKADPLATLERCSFVDLEAGFKKQRYQMLALIYGFAQIARRDDAVWHAFIGKEFWNHRTNTLKRADVLRMAMQYSLAAPIGHKRYERASNYAKALAGFFEENVPMEDIPERIELGGGIEKLARPATRSAQERPATVAIRHVTEQINDDDNVDEPAPGHLRPTASPPSEDAATPTSRGSQEKWPRFNPDDHLLVEMDDDQLATTLSKPLGGHFEIVVHTSQGEGKLIKVKAISVNRLHL